jgi:hypothetical protein
VISLEGWERGRRSDGGQGVVSTDHAVSVECWWRWRVVAVKDLDGRFG